MSKQGPIHQPTTERKVTFAETDLPQEQIPAAKTPKPPANYNKLDGELVSASTALKRASQPSLSEGRVDKLAFSVETFTSAFDIQAIESNISGWAGSSKVLMSALDGVAAIHPVVGVVVLAFKAVVTLEMKRRDTDKKVVALYLQMQEMMSVLLQLRGIDDQRSDGVMLRHRLESLMIKIAQDITECGNVCDTYSKKNILVKVLKSPIYEQRFANYLTTFSNRQMEIQFALILHTSLVVESASSKINSVHDKASSADDKLTLLFRRLDSPHESELMKFIDMKGGTEKIMTDDKALMELAAIQKVQGGLVVVNTSPEEGATAALGGSTHAATTSFPTTTQYRVSHSPYIPAERHHSNANASYEPQQQRPPSYSYGPQQQQPLSYSYGSQQQRPSSHSYGPQQQQPFPYSYGTQQQQPLSYSYELQQPWPSSYSPQPPITRSTSYGMGPTQSQTYGYPASTPHRWATPQAQTLREPGVTATVSLDDLKWELSEDVDLVLKRNMAIFIRKFDVQKRQLVQELTAVVKTQSDRVIQAVNAGPHDRVVDRDFRAIWQDMGWRTSVKARTFVFAVHAYFTERYHDTNPLQIFLTTDTPKGIEDFRRAQALANKKADDWEAVEYIRIVNLRPILESIDDDQSGYVTIREVNSFTAAKPEYMSLPEWISYWAAGISFFPNTKPGIISNMYDSRKHLLPTNRAMVDIYLDSPALRSVDLIMDPLEPFVTKLDDNIKQKSLRYAKEEEKRMEANLSLMAYEIDAFSTLALITGSGRIEKYLLTLLFLLLRHHLRIINVAAREILAREEINTAVNSIQVVLNTVGERAHTLKVIFREYAWSDASAGILTSTAFGLFAKLSEPSSTVYMENLRGSYQDDEEPDALQGRLLKHRVEELDRTTYDLMPIVSPTVLGEPSRSPLEGTWSGFVEGGGDGHGILQVDFSLHFAHTRTLQGSGLDVHGPFEVLGSVHDDSSFTVTLKREGGTAVSDSVIPLYLSGKLEPSKYKLEVEWGTGPGPRTGKMTLYPGPSELTRFRWNTTHPGNGLDRAPAQVRWSFACSAILDQVKAKMWCWSFFRDRRERRRDYTTLYRRHYLLGFLEGEEVSRLATLERTLSPLDVRLYRSICRSHYSICHHLGTFCGSCRNIITGDRFMCVNDICLQSFDSTNFCSACVNWPLLDGFSYHQPDHPLLKFSRFVQNRERFGFVEAAISSLGRYNPKRWNMTTADPTVCSVCHSTEKRLYWCCVICRENVMICENCDPQRLLNIHAVHDESHPMLRIEKEEEERRSISMVSQYSSLSDDPLRYLRSVFCGCCSDLGGSMSDE